MVLLDRNAFFLVDLEGAPLLPPFVDKIQQTVFERLPNFFIIYSCLKDD